MPSIKVEMQGLLDFQKQIQKLSGRSKERLCKNIATETAKVLFDKVKQKTPVKTGRLKRNWKIKGERTSNGYMSVVYNQTYYAPFVEYGHIVHTKKGDKWVEGRYMLTKAQKETLDLYTKIATKRVISYFNATRP